MQTIFELSSEVVSQIAAGEVIERPAYVVKELLDNAFDAQATSITIDISQAGFERITISDNGIGMTPEDLEMAPKIHTTSKISTIDDLENIGTLGFRGEALASIAAVSQLTIASRHSDYAIGTQWKNQTQTVSPVGMSIGTRIEVEHLFSKIPARQKFLKSKQTEKRLIVDIVISYALAHSDRRILFTHDQKIVFDLHPESILDRYDRLVGTMYSKNVLPISVHDSYLELTGYIGKPIASMSSNRGQYIYINDRPITDKLISTALKEAYGNLLAKDFYPTAILFFKIPTQLVDSNVHPRKEQVNFLNPTLLYEQIVATVGLVLREHDLTFVSAGMKGPLMQTQASVLLKEVVLPQKEKLPKYNFDSLVQWHQTYFCIETESGVLFFDQHAVHERILYERFSLEWKKQQKTTNYTTLSPVQQFSLPPADVLVLQELEKFWSTLGFRFAFRSTKVLVLQVPSLIADRSIEELVGEWIASERAGVPIRSIDNLSSKMLAYLACRNAIKAGDILSKDRMRELIEELQHTPNSYTCPHGRPTMIEMKKEDFDVMFKRA